MDKQELVITVSVIFVVLCIFIFGAICGGQLRLYQDDKIKEGLKLEIKELTEDNQRLLNEIKKYKMNNGEYVTAKNLKGELKCL